MEARVELTAVAGHMYVRQGSGGNHGTLLYRGVDLPSRKHDFRGSTRCRRLVVSWRREVHFTAAGSSWGEKRIVERLWEDFFSDPSHWWDHRSEKGSARYPDFKHKKTQEGLWLESKLNPHWVKGKLAAVGPLTLQSNIFSWNAKLSRYVKGGQCERAMELFQQMERDGVIPDRFTFTRLLNACAHLQSLEEGRRIHAQIIQSGLDCDGFVGSSLVHMYARCGSIEDAQRVFDGMSTRNVVSWTVMIKGLVKCGQGRKALELSRQMQIEGVEPDIFSFVGVLNACASVAALEEGRVVHAQIILKGCESDMFIGNSLIDMYAKCQSIEDAWRVFVNMPTHNVISWNAMILGFVKCKQGQKALDLFHQMQQEGVKADSVTFVGVLNACAILLAIVEGRRIHELIIQQGWEFNTFVVNSLINMYAKCGRIEDAWRAFSKTPTHDVVSWNAIILGHVKCGEGQKALALSRQMQMEGVKPDSVTCVGIVSACASLGALDEGMVVHSQIIQSGFESDMFVGSSLVDMYAKCGQIGQARRLFNKMPVRDVVAWNSMILAYVKCGQGQKALELYHQMQQEEMEPNALTFVGLVNACASVGVLEEGRTIHSQIMESGFQSDVYVGTSLVDMYAKCGSLEDALKVFSSMPIHNVVSWTALILGHVRCGQVPRALNLFQEMQHEGLKPDAVTFVVLLDACGIVGALENGRQFHHQIVGCGLEADIWVNNCLIGMYAKCGSIDDAQSVFNKMPTRNELSWTTMLAGYAIHGKGEDALRHFERMCGEGLELNKITFVHLLSACGHAGLVNKGLTYFESMNSVYGILPTVEHYAWKVYLLGRAGRLHEGEATIQEMSPAVDATVWMSMLAACRVDGNLDMGERIAKQVIQLDPGNAAGYVLLSNIYSATGRCRSSAKVKWQMSKKGVEGQQGCTSIEVNSEVYLFRVDDHEHPQILEIHAKLKQLYSQMIDEGYKPDKRFALHDISEGESLLSVGDHSEKLAIVLGLISTSTRTPIRIFKNLRVCYDCHTTAKLISKIVQREIILRDFSRFHHFQDGHCSCRDYW